MRAYRAIAALRSKGKAPGKQAPDAQATVLAIPCAAIRIPVQPVPGSRCSPDILTMLQGSN